METDDCIEFSRRIGIDLETHGERMRKAFVRRFKGPIPRISSANFSSAQRSGLMPDAAQYDALANSYITMVSATDGAKLKKVWVRVRRGYRKIGWKLGLKGR